MLKPSVQIREESGVLTAEFWDCLRLDPAPIADLRREFEDYRQRTGRDELVIDLNGVAFAGSAALGGFLAMRKQGARLIFCNVDPTVREVFRVTKLDNLFGFAADKAAAIVMANTTDAGGRGVPTPSKPPGVSNGPAPLRRRRNP